MILISFNHSIMEKERVETTLFILSSVDGKITTGDRDMLDMDSDFSRIKGVKEGLHQYYEIEKTTDLHSFITGRVMSKCCKQLNINKRKDTPEKTPVNFVVADSDHLNKNGILFLLKKVKKLLLVTNNKKHSAYRVNEDNLEIVYYSPKIDFQDLFVRLRKKYGIRKLTVQSGGTLNSILLRSGLIDHISLVIAPALIGGKNTSALIDGESLHFEKDLKNIKALKLRKCKMLKNSYLYLYYDVINNTEIANKS